MVFREVDSAQAREKKKNAKRYINTKETKTIATIPHKIKESIFSHDEIDSKTVFQYQFSTFNDDCWSKFDDFKMSE